MTSGEDFRPHDISWTREKVVRFWNYRASTPAHEASYFSKQVGDTVIKLVERRIRLRGRRVLDFGCGPGFLLEKLVARNAYAEGIDSSVDSIEAAKARMAGAAFFEGAHLAAAVPTPLAADAYDAVFFLETVEHLLDAELSETLEELRRIIRRGGHLIVTTPNQEDIEAGKVLCPECGATFHRMQHVRSWESQRLASFMNAHGFAALLIKTITLRPSFLATLLFDVLAPIVNTPKVNLIYIGQKR